MFFDDENNHQIVFIDSENFLYYSRGALPIQIFENGKPVGGTIYFHQAPPR